jgi:hypothetical protein
MGLRRPDRIGLKFDVAANWCEIIAIHSAADRAVMAYSDRVRRLNRKPMVPWQGTGIYVAYRT